MALHLHPHPHALTTLLRRARARLKDELRHGPVRCNLPFTVFAAGVLTAMAYLGALLLRVS